MLVLDIEQGDLVFIPKELSQDQFPLSFQYYDPIEKMASRYLSPEKYLAFQTQQVLNIARVKSNSTKLSILKMIGIGKYANKLEAAPVKINDLIEGQIDTFKSEHTMALQRSKYIRIENDID